MAFKKKSEKKFPEMLKKKKKEDTIQISLLMSSHYGTGPSSLMYARPVAVFKREGKGEWLRQEPYGQSDLKCSR